MIDDAFRDEHRISPSQVETAELCERKWAFEKIEGREKPPNKYADRGTAVHDVLELWQSEGIAVDLTTDIGKMVSAGLKFLPQPKSHKTEHPFLFRTSNAVYHGYMDLRGQLWFPIQTVWDHKSTTSFTWMKTPEVLRKDPQAVIYTKAVLEECKLEGRELGKEIQRVELNWVYYLANPDTPRSRKVQLHVMPPDAERLPVCPPDVHKEHFGIMYIDELEERFQEIETLSKRLLNHYHDKPNPMELPYNASACSAYGGCPFRNNPCKLTMSERIQSMATQEEGKKLSMKEKMELRLSNQKNGAAAQADKAAPAAATTTKAAPAAAAAPEVPKVNPPEQGNGVDPDEPGAGSRNAEGAVVGYGRTEIAAMMAQGLVSARVYSSEGNNRYPVQVAKEAVLLTDALLAELAK